MAGKSRPPSYAEIDPDLSIPAPKKSKTNEDEVLVVNNTSFEEQRRRTTSASELSLETNEVLPSSDESFGEGDDKSKNGSDRESVAAIAVKQVVEEAGPSSSSSTVERKQTTETVGNEAMNKETGPQGILMGERPLYRDLSKIGDGAYGTVYKANDTTTGQLVALKKVRVPVTEDGWPTSTLREIAALKQLEGFEHPHIVKLLDVCQGNYRDLAAEDGKPERIDRGVTLWLVFEHVEQDLAAFMQACQSRQTPPSIIKQMSKEILLGVDFLHSHRIVHRDLKPQNLLVTKDGHIKIADFGLAKTYDFEMRLTSVVVTLWYRAPEVLLGCTYATPIDIWSVGCILAELNELKPLFPGTNEGDQLDKIFRIIGTPPEEEWPESISIGWSTFPFRHSRPMKTVIPNLSDSGIDLVRSMLIFNPHKRATAAQALTHSYFLENEF